MRFKGNMFANIFTHFAPSSVKPLPIGKLSVGVYPFFAIIEENRILVFDRY